MRKTGDQIAAGKELERLMQHAPHMEDVPIIAELIKISVRHREARLDNAVARLKLEYADAPTPTAARSRLMWYVTDLYLASEGLRMSAGKYVA